ncbi:xylulokinase [Lentilactobacillus sp. SPB1-3]|uniref:Xylulokinase n=1 Tax=Lentilactobacillus terminaliae TaxID=3003483 RepID=A0ACD5DE37_9LACO|nr:FGGY-family carbohydrate kinase [Lentilactobacillus sp. SPB1-3]MCZ0977555.1 FGGY-family carbohydrate kinase [Lentilactobacillus sp. SPB1-3]
MDKQQLKDKIVSGNISLGIELGSTRIKSVLVTDDFQTIASGDFIWENELDNGIWTYSLDKVWNGIQTSYANMAREIHDSYGVDVKNIGSIGVSAMMHGYMPFDKNGKLLVPFRTWRNNITGQAADKLTELFDFNIPERWSIAHLYQAVLNNESHIDDVDFITSLAGYVTWKISGKKVLGIGDASGVFPIDNNTKTYDTSMLKKFNDLDLIKARPWDIQDVLPDVLLAGDTAGQLTRDGAKLIDASGQLEAGSLIAPPEGDAGTGMVSTNAVKVRTGNVSAGTSAFSMVVLDEPMKSVHRDIDIVTTPDGAPVAMVHINNGSSDINAWVSLFNEFSKLLGVQLSPNDLYGTLFSESVKGDQDAGGLVNFSYLSGENITRVPEGRPMFVRKPDAKMNLANFIKTQLYSAFAPLKIGMDILLREEHIKTNVLIAQGGLFKTPVVAQQVLADALDTPITVMDNAGEGGPWGMAILALYAVNKETGESLSSYLENKVFKDATGATLNPVPESVAGYDKFIDNYKAALPAEQNAVESMKMNK